MPAEVVVWGDPDAGNNETFWAVRDADDSELAYLVVGTDGRVQFSNGKVCNVCAVENSTILVDGMPRMNIRFSSGPDGEGNRYPFLVSTDGFYIELVADTGDAVIFQAEDTVFEEEDDPSDDLAERAGTIANPLAG